MSSVAANVAEQIRREKLPLFISHRRNLIPDAFSVDLGNDLDVRRKIDDRLDKFSGADMQEFSAVIGARLSKFETWDPASASVYSMHLSAAEIANENEAKRLEASPTVRVSSVLQLSGLSIVSLVVASAFVNSTTQITAIHPFLLGILGIAGVIFMLMGRVPIE